MANPEHVEIVKAGKEAIDQWNKECHDTVLDLSCAELCEINLADTDLDNVNLSYANLSRANLNRTSLRQAYLRDVNLSNASILGARLMYADLCFANLRNAKLDFTNLSFTDLCDANFTGAELHSANLSYSKLSKANFNHTILGGTMIVRTNLSSVRNLELCMHDGPSILDRSVLIDSGPLPEKFLHGCGLQDWEIESAKFYDPKLTPDEVTEIMYKVQELRAGQPIQVQPVFISYSHVNKEFVDRMGDTLDSKGIRYWRDVKNAEAGPIESVLGRAIAMNPVFLLVLSEASIKSGWVQYEIETASEMGLKEGRHVLCPIMLDDSWLRPNMLSGKVVMQIKKYMVTDFAGWEDDGKFEEAFLKLYRGWTLHYSGN